MPSVSIYKPDDRKIWMMAWRDPDSGKLVRKSTGARHKSNAAKIAKKQEELLDLDPWGLAPSSKNKPIRWDEFEPLFTAHIKSKSRPQTVAIYERTVAAFGRFVGGETMVHDVTVATLQDYIRHRQTPDPAKKGKRGETVRNTTINKDLRHIRTALNWAEERGYMPRSPRFKGLFLREDKKAPVVVPRTVRTKLFAAFDDAKLDVRFRSAQWWRTFALLVADLGIRTGEALGLAWSSVDLRGRVVTIQAETSKSRSSRELPLTDDLAAQLRRWRKEVPDDGLVLPWPAEHHLRSFYADWRRIVVAAGLPAGTRPCPKHFRSTAGSELIAAGVPTMTVRDYLGHSSVVVTENHYLHTTAATMRAAVDARSALAAKSTAEPAKK